MHFVERTDDIETSCDYTPPTKIIRFENNGIIEDVHVIESEQEEVEAEDVMYLYVTEEGAILTTDGQHVVQEEETVEQTFIGNDQVWPGQEQVIFIEVDENNENYTTVDTEEVDETTIDKEESVQEEVLETYTDEPTTESVTIPEAAPFPTEKVIIEEVPSPQTDTDESTTKPIPQTVVIEVPQTDTDKSIAKHVSIPTRTVIIKSPPSSTVISIPEKRPNCPKPVQLWRCMNHCGSQFIHAADLVRHQTACDFKDRDKTSPPLEDFDKLSDEIITYFEVICEKGSRNTVKRKHKWLWQFLKEMLNDPIEFSCAWTDRTSGCFEISNKEMCNAKWENYKHVKKMSTVGYGKQEFAACFDWYQKINILRQNKPKGESEDQSSFRYQFHPTFYHDFFEPYKFLTSIPRDLERPGKLFIPPVKKSIIRKLKSPKSPMYCSKNCGSQYINSSALESHEKVCLGVSASTSTNNEEEENLIEKSSEVTDEAVKEDDVPKDFAIVYPTNNKNVVMCSLCRKFWNTTGLKIHMKKAHGLSKVKVQTMDVYSPNKPVTVRFDKVGEVTL